MARCKVCGAKLSKGDIFCGECGASLISAPKEPSHAPAAEKYDVFVIVCCVAGIVLLLFSIVFFRIGWNLFSGIAAIPAMLLTVVATGSFFGYNLRGKYLANYYFSRIQTVLSTIQDGLARIQACLAGKKMEGKTFAKYLFVILLAWAAGALYAADKGHIVIASIYFISILCITVLLSCIKRKLAVVPCIIALVVVASLLGIVPKSEVLLDAGKKFFTK